MRGTGQPAGGECDLTGRQEKPPIPGVGGRRRGPSRHQPFCQLTPGLHHRMARRAPRMLSAGIATGEAAEALTARAIEVCFRVIVDAARSIGLVVRLAACHIISIPYLCALLGDKSKIRGARGYRQSFYRRYFPEMFRSTGRSRVRGKGLASRPAT